MEIKDIIHKKRVELGYTMKELAQMLDVSEATISRWESGKLATMKHTKIMALAKALHISPADLFEKNTDSEISLTQSELAHLNRYQQLTPDNRNAIDKHTEFLLHEQGATYAENQRSDKS